ncbi:MAG: ABC transporter substrate-binding protein [Sphaerochaetaceae bacterium]
MKKIIIAIMVLMVCLLPIMANGVVETTDTLQLVSTKTEVNILSLKGPTSMGLAKLYNDSDLGLTENKYNYILTGAPDQAIAALVKGTVDLAAVPANLAAVLNVKTGGKLQVVAINTLGVIYVLENGNEINSIQDLKGKTIFASGKGSTPEYALNFILESNNLVPGKDLTIEWKSEHSECLTELATTPNSIAMLPQPFVTTALMKIPEARIIVDLTKAWEEVEKDSTMITGVIVGQREFLQENPEAVASFLDAYHSSVDFCNDNPAEAAVLIGNLGIVTKEIAEKAIPDCNIVCIEGDEMKSSLKGYLEILFQQDPMAVGGSLPDDSFYFER